MSADDLRQRITAWCLEADDLAVTEGDPGERDDFALHVTRTDPGPASVAVIKPTGSPRVVIRHQAAARADGVDSSSLERYLRSRPGGVGGRLDDTNGAAVIEMSVWIDGLSRNAFHQAVAEVIRSGEGVASLESSEVRPAAAAPEPVAAWSGVAAESATGETLKAEQDAQPALGGADEHLPRPTEIPSPEAVAAEGGTAAAMPVPVTPMPTPALEPAAAPDASRWSPTHTAPAGGMPAWASPDPAQAPVARLDPHLQVQVTEQAGGWAHILCSNGWAAWVDGRLLIRS